jgi:uncharacterized protein YbjT (DUF2867 family)
LNFKAARKAQRLKAEGAETIMSAFESAQTLSHAFRGADLIFSFLPPSYATEDMGAYQDEVGEAIINAVNKTGIRKVINLSSIGAQHAAGVGPVAGLYRQEQRLNALGVDVLHVRPSYFMENFHWAIPTIKTMGVVGGAIHKDIGIPMIATTDIAVKIAEASDRELTGSAIFEIVGPEDVSHATAAALLGKAIGKPDLAYAEMPYEALEKALLESGMKPKTAASMIDLYRGVNEGRFVPTQTIDSDHRGKTTFVEFARMFARLYDRGK